MPSAGAGFGALLVFVMPVSLLLMAIKQRGPVAQFLRAGAVSPDTARRPASLAIRRLYLIENAIKRGELIATGDGRYYLDLAVNRRRRRVMIGAAALLTIAGIASVLIILL